MRAECRVSCSAHSAAAPVVVVGAGDHPPGSTATALTPPSWRPSSTGPVPGSIGSHTSTHPWLSPGPRRPRKDVPLGVLRDRVLFETAYVCGARASEVCGMHVEDLDLA